MAGGNLLSHIPFITSVSSEQLSVLFPRWQPNLIRNRLVFFFQYEEIFVHLDKLDELNRITYAWIGFNYSLTQA